jgi:hypothetical protein
MTVQTECARWVVDRYKALPLLHSEGLCRVDAKPYCFALRIERIEVDVRDNSKRRLCAV